MNIGKVKLKSPVFLAPMAGYTDSAFRVICKEKGAGMVYTEFVSSEGIVRNSSKTIDYLKFEYIERPIGIQIFGHDPHIMAEAATFIEEKFQPDIIDLNFGCPVKKVTRTGAGSALLKNIPLTKIIASEVVKNTSTPITAKLRSGWNSKDIVAINVSKILEDAGISAITIHPKPSNMGYNKSAIWSIIRDVKLTVEIPVIGNGDVLAPEDAKRMFQETGCDAIMIGRGALGNPWIFQKTNNLLLNCDYSISTSPKEIIELCLHHFLLEINNKGETIANRIMKKHIPLYFKGWRNASQIRKQLQNSSSAKETINILESLKNSQ